MQYVQLQGDVLVGLAPNQEIFANDAWHPYGNLNSMTAAETHAIGVYELPPLPEPIYGQSAMSHTPVLDGDQVAWLTNYQEISLSMLKGDKLSQLATLRWNKAQFFTYDGVTAPADPALTAVTGAVVAAQVSPSSAATTWKLAPGAFRQWTTAQIIGYGLAIRGHVQTCFDREEALSIQIAEATTAEELQAIDIDTGWPT